MLAILSLKSTPRRCILNIRIVSEWEVRAPLKGHTGKPRMIRPNYPNIYPNYHRIATRATRRCRLATRENSREVARNAV